MQGTNKCFWALTDFAVLTSDIQDLFYSNSAAGVADWLVFYFSNNGPGSG